MTEDEVRNIEVAAQKVLDHKGVWHQTMAMQTVLALCTALRAAWARIAELEAQTVRLAMCHNCLQMYIEDAGICGFCGAVQ